jgi:hypothetical protein
MGKLLPVPYPGQSMDEYREQLVNFQKNYWSFLKSSKGGSKFIPLPPEHLNPNNKQNETKEMSAKKLSEQVESELFNKEKRVTAPKIVKEPIVGESEIKPVKKKRPYYRKKNNKPTTVESVPSKSYKNIKVEPVKFLPELVNQHLFIKGLLVGSVLTAIICHIIYSI